MLFFFQSSLVNQWGTVVHKILTSPLQCYTFQQDKKQNEHHYYSEFTSSQIQREKLICDWLKLSKNHIIIWDIKKNPNVLLKVKWVKTESITC